MPTAALLESIILGGFAYLAYLLFEYRDRAIGTTKRKDPLFTDVPGRPLIGQLIEKLTNISQCHESTTLRGLKLRPGYSVTLPGVRVIDVSKPDWIEYIQKTNFHNYAKGEMFRAVMFDLFGNGIAASDGEAWKKARKATARVFHVKNFKTVIEPSIEHSLDGLLQVLQTASDKNQDLDFCALFTRFTLDSFVKVSFGRALGLYGQESTAGTELEASNKNICSPEEFAEALDYSQKQIDFRFTVMTSWKLYEKINYRVGQRMKRSCDIIHNYADTLIDERMSNISSQNFTDSETSQNDALGMIMDYYVEQGEILNRRALRDGILSFLLAARDATAQSLSWCLFHILMNKDSISKIREEAAELLGENPSHQGRVTHNNYKQFTYTYAAILESIRLHPPLPQNMAFAKEDDIIPGGPTIEAGDCVSWCDWQMARDPEIWGPDCGQFKPTRWIDEAGKIQNFGSFKYHAFNGGPRICLGMNMAIFLEVKVIVEILQKYDLEFSKGWLENVPKTGEIEGIKTNYPTPHHGAGVTLPMEKPMMISVKPLLGKNV